MAADMWWRERFQARMDELGIDPGSSFGMGFQGASERQVVAMGRLHTEEVVRRNQERAEVMVSDLAYNHSREAVASALSTEEAVPLMTEALEGAIQGSVNLGMDEIRSRSLAVSGILRGLTAEAHSGSIDMAYNQLNALAGATYRVEGSESGTYGESPEFGPMIAQKYQELANIESQRVSLEAREAEGRQKTEMAHYHDVLAQNLWSPKGNPMVAMEILEVIRARQEAGELPPGAYAEFTRVINAARNTVDRSLVGLESRDLGYIRGAEAGTLDTSEILGILEDPTVGRDVKAHLQGLLVKTITGEPDRAARSFRSTLDDLDTIAKGLKPTLSAEDVQRRMTATQLMDAWRAANPNATEDQINMQAEAILTNVYRNDYVDRDTRAQQVKEEAENVRTIREARIQRAEQAHREALDTVTRGIRTAVPMMDFRDTADDIYSRREDGVWHTQFTNHAHLVVEDLNTLAQRMGDRGMLSEVDSIEMGLLNRVTEVATRAQNEDMRSRGFSTQFPMIADLNGVLSDSDVRMITRLESMAGRSFTIPTDRGLRITPRGLADFYAFMSGRLSERMYQSIGEARKAAEATQE